MQNLYANVPDVYMKITDKKKHVNHNLKIKTFVFQVLLVWV